MYFQARSALGGRNRSSGCSTNSETRCAHAARRGFARADGRAAVGSCGRAGRPGAGGSRPRAGGRARFGIEVRLAGAGLRDDVCPIFGGPATAGPAGGLARRGRSVARVGERRGRGRPAGRAGARLGRRGDHRCRGSRRRAAGPIACGGSTAARTSEPGRPGPALQRTRRTAIAGRLSGFMGISSWEVSGDRGAASRWVTLTQRKAGAKTRPSPHGDDAETSTVRLKSTRRLAEGRKSGNENRAEKSLKIGRDDRADGDL